MDKIYFFDRAGETVQVPSRNLQRFLGTPEGSKATRLHSYLDEADGSKVFVPEPQLDSYRKHYPKAVPVDPVEVGGADFLVPHAERAKFVASRPEDTREELADMLGREPEWGSLRKAVVDVAKGAVKGVVSGGLDMVGGLAAGEREMRAETQSSNTAGWMKTRRAEVDRLERDKAEGRGSPRSDEGVLGGMFGTSKQQDVWDQIAAGGWRKEDEDRLTAARRDLQEMPKDIAHYDTVAAKAKVMRKAITGAVPWAQPDGSESKGEYLGRVLGSGIPTLGGAVAVSAVAGPMAGGLVLGRLDGMQEYLDERAKGIDPAEASRFALLTSVVSAGTEWIPLEVFNNLTARRALRAALGGATEGVQEVVQQVSMNVLALNGPDIERSWRDQAWESFVGGAAAGGVVAGLGYVRDGRDAGGGKLSRLSAADDVLRSRGMVDAPKSLSGGERVRLAKQVLSSGMESDLRASQDDVTGTRTRWATQWLMSKAALKLTEAERVKYVEDNYSEEAVGAALSRRIGAIVTDRQEFAAAYPRANAVLDAHKARFTTRENFTILTDDVAPTFNFEGARANATTETLSDGTTATRFTCPDTGISVMLDANGSAAADAPEGMIVPQNEQRVFHSSEDNGGQSPLEAAITYAEKLSAFNQIRESNNELKYGFISELHAQLNPGSKLVVYDSPLALPPAVRAVVAGKDGSYNRDDDTMYVDLNAIRSPAHAATVLAHETFHDTFAKYLTLTGQTEEQVFGVSPGKLTKGKAKSIEEQLAYSREQRYERPDKWTKVKAALHGWWRQTIKLHEDDLSESELLALVDRIASTAAPSGGSVARLSAPPASARPPAPSAPDGPPGPLMGMPEPSPKSTGRDARRETLVAGMEQDEEVAGETYDDPNATPQTKPVQAETKPVQADEQDDPHAIISESESVDRLKRRYPQEWKAALEATEGNHADAVGLLREWAPNIERNRASAPPAPVDKSPAKRAVARKLDAKLDLNAADLALLEEDGVEGPDLYREGYRLHKPTGEWRHGDTTAKREAAAKAKAEAPPPVAPASTGGLVLSPEARVAADALKAKMIGLVTKAGKDAATSPHNNTPLPTQAQKDAGNYKKGHVRLHGLEISIENPRGSVRTGTSPDGKHWERKMTHSYGYIRGSKGADGDHVDVFLTDDAGTAVGVWVVDQKKADGSFDEHKAVMGPANEAEARKAYLSNYEAGWDGIGAITFMSMKKFRHWAGQRKHTQPVSYAAPRKVKTGLKDESADVKRVAYEASRTILQAFSRRAQRATPAELSTFIDEILNQPGETFLTMFTADQNGGVRVGSALRAFQRKSPTNVYRLLRGAGVGLDAAARACHRKFRNAFPGPYGIDQNSAQKGVRVSDSDSGKLSEALDDLKREIIGAGGIRVMDDKGNQSHGETDGLPANMVWQEKPLFGRRQLAGITPDSIGLGLSPAQRTALGLTVGVGEDGSELDQMEPLNDSDVLAAIKGVAWDTSRSIAADAADASWLEEMENEAALEDEYDARAALERDEASAELNAWLAEAPDYAAAWGEYLELRTDDVTYAEKLNVGDSVLVGGVRWTVTDVIASDGVVMQNGEGFEFVLEFDGTPLFIDEPVRPADNSGDDDANDLPPGRDSGSSPPSSDERIDDEDASGHGEGPPPVEPDAVQGEGGADGEGLRGEDLNLESASVAQLAAEKLRADHRRKLKEMADKPLLAGVGDLTPGLPGMGEGAKDVPLLNGDAIPHTPPDAAKTTIITEGQRKALQIVAGFAYDPWRMMGPANAKNRAKVMGYLIGGKATQAQSGVNAIIAKLFELSGTDQYPGTLATKYAHLEAWIKATLGPLSSRDSLLPHQPLDLSTGTGTPRPVPDRIGAEYVVHLRMEGGYRVTISKKRTDGGGTVTTSGIGTSPEDAYAEALRSYDVTQTPPSPPSPPAPLPPGPDAPPEPPDLPPPPSDRGDPPAPPTPPTPSRPRSPLEALSPENRDKAKAAQVSLRAIIAGRSDAEIITVGPVLAELYVATGVIKTFRVFATAVKSDMPDVWDGLKAHLHSFWQSLGATDASLDDVNRTDARAIIAGIDATPTPRPVAPTAPRVDPAIRAEVEASPNPFAPVLTDAIPTDLPAGVSVEQYKAWLLMRKALKLEPADMGKLRRTGKATPRHEAIATLVDELESTADKPSSEALSAWYKAKRQAYIDGERGALAARTRAAMVKAGYAEGDEVTGAAVNMLTGSDAYTYRGILKVSVDGQAYVAVKGQKPLAFWGNPWRKTGVKEVASPSAAAPTPPAAPAPDPVQDEIRGIIRDTGKENKSMALRRLAKRLNIPAKDAQERAELEVVRLSHEIASDAALTPEERFQRILKVYREQPSMTARTSDTIRRQAYSTPAPMAYALSYAIGVTPQTAVYDPTAGNGMLLIGSDLAGTTANELDPVRAAHLKALGVGTVTQNDATEYLPTGTVTTVATNPPFGAFPVRAFDKAKVNRIDHWIALRALSAMADNGRAVIILGANMNAGVINRGAQWVFDNYVHGHYNVVTEFEADGALYARQGAAWPVRILIINGRKAVGKTEKTVPKALDRLTSWEDIWARVKEAHNDIDTTAASMDAGREGGLPLNPQADQPGSVPLGSSPVAGDVGVGSERVGDRGSERHSAEDGRRRGGRPTVAPQAAAVGPDNTGTADTGVDASERVPGGGVAGRGAGTGPDRAGSGPSNGGRIDGTAQPRELPVAPSPVVKSPLANVSPELAARAAALKAQWAAITKGRMNAGVDPELIAVGVQLAKIYIQGGVKTFAQFAATVKSEMAEIWDRIKTTLHGIWQSIGVSDDTIDDVSRAQAKAILDKLDAPPKQKQTTDRQVPYQPSSGGEAFGMLTPGSMAKGTHAYLAKMKAEVGALEDYVAGKLHLDTDHILRVLKAEQVDGVAMAIYQIENGGALIIGDETGMGKGRQAAAIYHYARVNGKIPFFFTADPKLFTDLYRDLEDMGLTAKPLLFGNDETAMVVSREGEIIIPAPDKRGQDRQMRRIKTLGMSAAGYDGIFATYSQVNAPNGRQAFLEELADQEDVIVILDEAHLAAGDATTSMQATFFTGGDIDRGKGSNRVTHTKRGILRLPGTQSGRGGVLYLSATFAKNPRNMGVYFRTLLSSAAQSYDQVIAALVSGGVAIQQAASEALAAAGQLIRRERDFSDVNYNVKKVVVADEAALIAEVDSVTNVLTEIMAFSRLVVAAVRQTGTGAASAKGATSQNATDFASVVHNQISQLILAAKCDSIVATAIEAHAKGEKPVIAVSNTMESFLDHFVEERGVKSNGPIMIRWNELLKVALARTLRVTETDANGDKTTTAVTPESLGLAEDFAAVMAMADAIDSRLPVSPIDYIIQKLNAAGIRMAELTGRTSGIEYASIDNGTGTYRVFKKATKNAIVDSFNGGRVDGMLLNASGSTGLSAHQSSDVTKSPDQRPRHMIIGQVAAEINTFIQTLGRIRRSGMVPGSARYTHLVLPLQAELRPAAVAMRKLNGLNANTTSDSEGVVSLSAVEFINKYGDRVVAEYLLEHPRLRMMLDMDATVREDQDELFFNEDIARQFTGRLAIRPDAEQKQVFSEVVPKYNELIETLKAAGEYDLEVTLHDDWAGVRESSEILTQGTDESNIFTASTKVQEWSLRDSRHVPTVEEIDTAVKHGYGGNTRTLQRALGAALDAAETAAREKVEKTGRDRDDAVDAHHALPAGDPREAAALALVGYNQVLADQAVAALDRLQHMIADVISNAGQWSTGFLRLSHATTGASYLAKLTDIRIPAPKAGQAFRPSNIRLLFAVAAPNAKVSMAYTDVRATGWSIEVPTDTEVAAALEEGRTGIQSRFVVTGNPVSAYAATGGRGQFVRFLSRDDELVSGLLMRRGWDPGQLANDPRLDLLTARAVAKFVADNGRFLVNGGRLELKGNLATLTIQRNVYEIRVARAVSTGGLIYLDTKLTAITGPFILGAGGRMQVHITPQQMVGVADRMMTIVGKKFRPNIPTNNPRDAADMVAAANAPFIAGNIRHRESGADAATEDIAVQDPDFLVSDSPDLRFRERGGDPPVKTIKAYKLLKFKVSRPGQMFPLFAGISTPTPVGVWVDAEIEKTVMAVRPGWHLAELPVARHIGKKNADGVIDRQKPDSVWVEVEVAADVDWQPEAIRRAKRLKNGEVDPVTAHIVNEIPKDGYYRYKTKQDMEGTWIIGGSMKINKILNDAEVDAILIAAGETPMPRDGGPIDLQRWGVVPELRFRQSGVTEAQDTEYMGAVQSGDMTAAQRMVDDAAKAAGYTLGRAYHGTTEEERFTEFDTRRSGYKFGPGSYFTINDKSRALNYGTRNRYRDDGEEQKIGNLYDAYLRLDNPYVVEGSESVMELAQDALREGKIKSFAPSGSASHVGNLMLRAQGYDGVIHQWENGHIVEVVVFHPEQIKEAVPVTRDDAGDVIPLSQRFDRASPDIRFREGGAGDDRTLPDPTRATQAAIAERRERLHQSLIEGPEPYTNQEALDDATAELVADPQRAWRIVEEVDLQARALSPVDHAVMLSTLVELRHLYNAAITSGVAARARGDIRGVQSASERADAAADQMSRLDKALAPTGTAAGRALQARKISINADWSLGAMRARALKSNDFNPLTPDQDAKIRELQERIAELEAEAAAGGTGGTGSTPGGVGRKTNPLDDIKAKKKIQTAEDIRERVRKLVEAGQRETAGGVSSLKQLIDMLALAIVTENPSIATDDFNTQLTDEVSEFVPGITELTVMQVLSGYGDSSQPSQDEVLKKLRELRAADLLHAKLADALAGEVPQRTGMQRDPQTQEARQLSRDLALEMKELARKMEELGIVTHDRDTRLRTVLDSLHTRLENEIMDMDAAIRTGRKLIRNDNAIPYDDEAKSLVARRDALKAIYAAVFPAAPMTAEKQMKAAVEAAERNLAYWMERVAKAKTGDMTGRAKAKPGFVGPQIEVAAINAKVADARREVARLRDEANPKLSPEAVAIRNRTRMYERLAEQYAARQAAGDFAPKPKRVLDLSDPNVFAAHRAAEAAKAEFRAAQEKWRLLHANFAARLKSKVVGTMDLQRQLLTTMDMSAVGNQGWWATLSHPILALQAMKKMGHAAVSDHDAAMIEKSIADRPNAVLYETAGLFLAPLDDAPTSQLEESFRSKTLDRIPGFKHVVRGSQRGFVTYLNLMRANLFDSMTARYNGAPTLEQAKLIANAVNVLLGRGSLFGRHADAWSMILFAPRYFASHVQLLALQPLWHGDMRTRTIIAREMAKPIAIAVAILLLRDLFAPPDDETEWDPRSPEFGKLKIANRRYDVLGPVARMFGFATRVLVGERKSRRGDIMDLRGANKSRLYSMKDELFGFYRGKASPLSGLAISAAIGENFTGKPNTVLSLVADNTTPISVRDIISTLRTDEGVPEKTLAVLAGFFGKNSYLPDAKEYADASALLQKATHAFDAAKTADEMLAVLELYPFVRNRAALREMNLEVKRLDKRIKKMGGSDALQEDRDARAALLVDRMRGE